jgi:hypothetical protein
MDLQKHFSDHFRQNVLIKPIFIQERGKYILNNDIIIDFPAYPTNDDIKNLPSLRYGFFGGIIITGENIELNLLGHELKMSLEFSLRQRFFSIIELTNSPFPLGKGLPLCMTKEKFQTGRMIRIHNGRLGLSSHSSIHGNENSNIVLSKLKMYDFEVGGVMLNGGKQISICKCTIGPNFQNLWVNAKFSAATQLLHHFYNVIPQTGKKSKNFLELEENVEKTFSAKTFEDVPLLFRNNERIIDGSVYGISLHKSGVAIGGHGEVFTDEKGSFGFQYTIRNVSIENLVGNVEEKMTHLYKGKPLRDISGQIIDLQGDMNYLVKVQLETKEWLENYLDFQSTFYVPLEFYKISMENDDGRVKDFIKSNFEIKLGRDIMLHVNKGVIAFRLDGIKAVEIERLSIQNIKNISTRISNDLTNLIFSNMEDLNDYTGNDTIGCCINNCQDLKGKSFLVKNIISKHGTSYGIIVMNLSKHVHLDDLDVNTTSNYNRKQYGIVLQDSVSNVLVKV